MKDLVRLLQLTRGHLETYGVAAAALVVGSVAFLLIPPQLGRLMASLPDVAAGHSGRAATLAVIAIALLLILNGAASLVYTFLVSSVSERIVNELRARFFRTLVNERLDERPPKALGEVASQFASDLSLVQDGLSITLTDCIRHAFITLGAFTALFLIDLRMTVLALLGVGSVAAVVVVFIRRITASIIAVQQWRGKVMTLLLEAAANAYIIQAYGRAGYMSARFRTWLNEMFRRVRGQMLLVACMNPVCMVLFAAVMTGLAVFGTEQLRHGRLTIPMLISYFTFVAVLVASVSQVGYLAGRLRQAGAMLAKHDRMLARVDTAPSLHIKPHEPKPIPPAAGPYGFAFRDVSFSYPGQESPVIAEACFEIPAGKVTAILGESGAGKSTVAALLCGLFRPQGGTVQVLDAEQTPTELKPASLRQQIAIVPQEPFLFAGTIFENIAFGREDISERQAQRAASAARIHDFIAELPGGYHASIDEAGKNLSRGQRQRLAIARALAGRPSVIIMDEATASLDVASERAIKALIDELRGSVTFVIIAHQGALLSGVDHCIALRRGAVWAEGSPSEVSIEAGGVLC